MNLTANVDMKPITEALKELARVTGKDIGEIVKQNARLLAWNLAISTQPWKSKEGNFRSNKRGETFYTGKADRLVGQAAVMRDVGRVFQSAQVVFDEISKQDEALAKAFYKAIKLGNVNDAEKLLRASNSQFKGASIEAFTKSAHQQLRINGKVKQRRPNIIALDWKPVAAYAKERAKLVGFAKSGFVAAGNQLGRVRNVPTWIKGNKGPGKGAANSGFNATATVESLVRYASDVIPDDSVKYALRIQIEKMLAHIEWQLGKRMRDKGFSNVQNTSEAVQPPTP
jgi:hypothetical protein